MIGNSYNIGVTPTSGPKIIGSYASWTLITWSDEIEFLAGHRLVFSDNYSKLAGDKVIREFSFHFMDAAGKCIFRFDTHGVQLFEGMPCHLHIGEELVDEGDPRLRGYSLENVNFLTVHGLIHKYLEGHGLPWL